MNTRQKIISKTAKAMDKGFSDCNYKIAKRALIAAYKEQSFKDFKGFCFYMRTAAKSSLKTQMTKRG